MFNFDGSWGPFSVDLGILKTSQQAEEFLGDISQDWGDLRDLSTGWGGGSWAPLFKLVSLGPVLGTRQGLVLLESNPGLWIHLVIYNCPGRLLGPHLRLLGFLGPEKDWENGFNRLLFLLFFFLLLLGRDLEKVKLILFLLDTRIKLWILLDWIVWIIQI